VAEPEVDYTAVPSLIEQQG